MLDAVDRQDQPHERNVTLAVAPVNTQNAERKSRDPGGSDALAPVVALARFEKATFSHSLGLTGV
jgi:hypothetical protein